MMAKTHGTLTTSSRSNIGERTVKRGQGYTFIRIWRSYRVNKTSKNQTNLSARQDCKKQVPTYEELQDALRIPEIEPKLDRLGRLLSSRNNNVTIWIDD